MGMRLAATSRVHDGAVLGRDVQTGRADGVPLLRAGVVITTRYRDALLRAGVNAIYVEDADSEGIAPEPLVTDATRAVATKAVGGAFKSVQETFHTGRPLAAETMDMLADTVDRILRELATSGEVALALEDLSSADAYTFQHSIDVTALGLLLGQRLFRERGWVDFKGKRRYDDIHNRLSQLGLGLLLHDIGKLIVPLDVLNKPGRLTSAEMALMRQHPRAGFEMLGDEVSALAKAVVLRHHERWDGTGYPDGRASTDIHQFARLASVADVYDAVTSQRSYAERRPASVAVRIIRDGAWSQFDPEVVDVFCRTVAPFPPGSELKLADGREAIVVSVPGHKLDRPVIRIVATKEQIELEAHPELQIDGWGQAAGAAERPEKRAPLGGNPVSSRSAA
jgi:HD-GYP domain-containing protein (c-di-GMP phosphodiesterase class II)